MTKKVIFLIFFFYLLVLIQSSFLVHFNLFGMVPNLVLITIILINLFVPGYQWWGVVAALIGGIYLDIFSLSAVSFFGFYTLISLLIAIFIKFILKKHVQLPKPQRRVEKRIYPL